MTLFLHIGAPRTGTSTLQSLMHHNRKRLAKLGLIYPEIAYTDPKLGDAQHNLAFSLMESYPAFVPEKAHVKPDTVWTALTDVLRNTDKNVFVSSEAFSALPPDAVRGIRDRLAGVDTDVIYVERDARSWHHSMGRQQIKQYPYRTSLPDPYLGPEDAITVKHTSAWTAAGFNPSRLTYGPDILSRLLAHIGIDHAALTPVIKRNDSLPMAVLTLLMRLNAIELPLQKRGRLNRMVEGWWFELARANPEHSAVPDILNAANTGEVFRSPAASPKTLRQQAGALRRSLLGRPVVFRRETADMPPATCEILNRLALIGLETDEHRSVRQALLDWITAQSGATPS